MKGYKLSEATKAKMRGNKNGRFNKGNKLTEEHKKHMRENHPRYWLGKKWTEEQKKKRSLSQMGDKNPKWRGGISTENERIRGCIEYEIWRNGVFARDGYTDQKTGKRGGDIVAHHILNFSSHPELRFAIDNGITLSVKAHNEFHKKYGKSNNTREQLLDFLNI